jgi:hypothetical protein
LANTQSDIDIAILEPTKLDPVERWQHQSELVFILNTMLI